MTPTGPDTPLCRINLLLRGNHAEFYVCPDQMPHLEDTLHNIAVMPINDPNLIKLATTNGTIHFMSNHLTGWVVQDILVKDKAP